MTTIPVSTDLRDKIKSFGKKGESYEDILMDKTNCLTLNEARAYLKKDD